MREIFKDKSVKVKRKLDNMDQVMEIVKLTTFNFLRKEVRNLDNKAKIWTVKIGD